MKHQRIIFAIIAPLLLASSLMSQTSDWQALQSLPSGTKIKVTLKQRPTFGHCFVEAVSNDQLACRTGRGFLSRSKIYFRDDIKTVYLAHNVPMIGLAIGAGGGAIIGATRSSCCHAANALLGAGALGLMGMFFGTVADPFVHGRVLYESDLDSYQGRSRPSSPVPLCLRDGVTMQCVR